MAVRAPHLHHSLRCFCLGAFHVLGAEDADLPFAFDIAMGVRKGDILVRINNAPIEAFA